MSFTTLETLYAAALVLQIALLVRSWKKNRWYLWLLLYSTEVISTVAALATMIYYNANPGYMLSTMGHTLISLLFTWVYFILLLITIPIGIVRAFTDQQDTAK